MPALFAPSFRESRNYRDELSTLMTERFAIVEVEPAAA
jgi:hypothetical protein